MLLYALAFVWYCECAVSCVELCFCMCLRLYVFCKIVLCSVGVVSCVELCFCMCLLLIAVLCGAVRFSCVLDLCSVGACFCMCFVKLCCALWLLCVCACFCMCFVELCCVLLACLSVVLCEL